MTRSTASRIRQFGFEAARQRFELSALALSLLRPEKAWVVLGTSLLTLSAWGIERRRGAGAGAPSRRIVLSASAVIVACVVGGLGLNRLATEDAGAWPVRTTIPEPRPGSENRKPPTPGEGTSRTMSPHSDWWARSAAIAVIAAAFYPKPVIVRLSDFKSDEYANLVGGERYEPNEDNPMLWFRGASRYISPDFHQAFSLECQALKHV